MNHATTTVEPSPPSQDCPEPYRWQAIDCISAEFEVIYFLMYLVNTIKPNYVVETGTCFGYTANAMAAGMSRGTLVTCDPEKKFLELKPNVKYLQCKSLEVVPEQPIDLLFLDSLPELRVEEYFYFKPFLSPRAIVVIHDTGESHPELRAAVEKLLEKEMNGLFLPTPRGLFIGRVKT
jgi:predicted O-methyltransferase YrrM